MRMVSTSTWAVLMIVGLCSATARSQAPAPETKAEEPHNRRARYILAVTPPDPVEWHELENQPETGQP